MKEQLNLSPWHSDHRTLNPRPRLPDHNLGPQIVRLEIHDDVEQRRAAHRRVPREIRLPADRIGHVVHVGENPVAEDRGRGVLPVHAVVHQLAAQLLHAPQPGVRIGLPWLVADRTVRDKVVGVSDNAIVVFFENKVA